jgi:hypothetical protein
MTEKGGLNKELQSTVAKYYNNLISDFQTNEKKIMGELDDLAKSAGAKKRKGDMNSAVEGTEEIRAW